MNKGKIMRKLLGQPTATTNESIDTNPADSPLLPTTASHNTTFKTRAAIACLAQSPDGQRAVIAGQKVFRILKVDGATISEELDLRSIISSYATSHDLTAVTADQLNIKAVAWSSADLASTIITASGNGRITVYDLNRAGEGLEVARIGEYTRQVHKLDISPFGANWFLSASQDGTVRSFDLRAPSTGRSGPGPLFQSKSIYKCNADAVRDVKWSPTDSMEFACSTDAGVIQKWDFRRSNAPLLKITAHQSACFSIAWHPDGNYLVSGGIDQHCHVWDLSKTAERSQKPRYSFNTPAPVSSVSWRPAYWSATANGRRAAQVAVVYDDTNAHRIQAPAVHIWDLARPGMPFKEVDKWDTSPTGLLWNTKDLLWGVDKEGNFTQTDVSTVSPLIDRRSLSTFAFSPTGDIVMLLEERQARRRPRLPLSSPDMSPGYQHSAHGPLLSASRSDSEEDVVGSFLGPRLRKRKQRSDRPQGLSNTPPSNTTNGDEKPKSMKLDDAIKVTGLYKPQQVVAIGPAPSTVRRSTYQRFTAIYLERLRKDATDTAEHQSTDARLASTMEYFAQAAESAHQYRLAQTWRLLAFTMNILLIRRADSHRQSRFAKAQQKPLLKSSNPTESKETQTTRDRGDDTPRKFVPTDSPFDSSPLHTASKAIMNDVESTSNVATPLVRPVRDTVLATQSTMRSPLVEDDILQLPGPINSSTPKPIPVPGSSLSSGYASSSVEGYDFYGMESLPPTIDYAIPSKKQPLRLDYSESSEVTRRMQPERHNSGESFAMFSTSGDSQSRFMSSSESEGKGPSSLRERVSSWENSHSSQSLHRPSLDSNNRTTSDSSDQHLVSRPQRQPEVHNGFHTQQAPPVFRIQNPSFEAAGNMTDLDPMEETIGPWSVETSDDPNIIESDFLPWPFDPDFLLPALDPKIQVPREINFQAQTGALNASVMVLLLRPFLQEGAIVEYQARAILAQYHQRLISMRLFTEATLLRSLCVPLYPNVFAMAQQDVAVGYFCTDCHKPLENDPLIPNSVWRCPRCQQNINACVICLQRNLDDYPYDDEETIDSVLWWYCPGCGHGGHTVCMKAWHAGPDGEEGSKYSNGCCPLEGCLHPCLPGVWRNERAEEKKAAKQREMDALVRENSRQGSRSRGVRRDAREVTQSKAVEGVRVALGVSSLERKKSVKVVAPGENT